MIRIHFDQNEEASAEDTARLFSQPSVMKATQDIIGNEGWVLKFYLSFDRGFPEVIAKAEPPDTTL